MCPLSYVKLSSFFCNPSFNLSSLLSSLFCLFNLMVGYEWKSDRKNSFPLLWSSHFFFVNSQRAFAIEMMILWLKNIKRMYADTCEAYFRHKLMDDAYVAYVNCQQENDRRALTAPHSLDYIFICELVSARRSWKLRFDEILFHVSRYANNAEGDKRGETWSK